MILYVLTLRISLRYGNLAKDPAKDALTCGLHADRTYLRAYLAPAVNLFAQPFRAFCVKQNDPLEVLTRLSDDTRQTIGLKQPHPFSQPPLGERRAVVLVFVPDAQIEACQYKVLHWQD